MAKKTTKGTVLEMTIGGVKTAVAQLTACKSPKVTPGTFETTTIDQDDSDLGEHHAATGYVKTEGFSATGFFDAELSTHVAVRSKALTAALGVFTVVEADGSECEFDAFISFDPKSDMKQGKMFEIASVAIDGVPTYTDP